MVVKKRVVYIISASLIVSVFGNTGITPISSSIDSYAEILYDENEKMDEENTENVQHEEQVIEDNFNEAKNDYKEDFGNESSIDKNGQNISDESINDTDEEQNNENSSNDLISNDNEQMNENNDENSNIKDNTNIESNTIEKNKNIKSDQNEEYSNVVNVASNNNASMDDNKIKENTVIDIFKVEDIEELRPNTDTRDLNLFTSGNFNYKILEDNTIEIKEYIGNELAIIIPSRIDEKDVTSIGTRAFYNNTTLEYVKIPYSVEKIGKEAFYGNASLEEVDIPGSVKIICQDAFRECGSLDNVVIPYGVTCIEHSAFNNCDNLKQIKLPDSLETIGRATFANCDSLESIEIPNSVKGNSYSLFENCSKLKSVKVSSNMSLDRLFMNCPQIDNLDMIPTNITSTGEHTFHKTGLSIINIPNWITTISEASFAGLNNLQTVHIPKSVKKIENYAFGMLGWGGPTTKDDIEKLGIQFIFEGDAPSFSEFCFDNTVATAYYPINNTTWTSDVMKNWGAYEITWIAYNESDNNNNNDNDNSDGSGADTSVDSTSNTSNSTTLFSPSSSSSSNNSNSNSGNGLKLTNSNWYCYENGGKVTNSWREFNYGNVTSKRFFDSNGQMQVGLQKVGDVYYYFQENEGISYGSAVSIEELVNNIDANSPATKLGSYNNMINFIENVDVFTELGYTLTSAKDTMKAMWTSLGRGDEILSKGYWEIVADQFMNDQDKCREQLRKLINEMTNSEDANYMSSTENKYLNVVIDLTKEYMRSECKKNGFDDEQIDKMINDLFSKGDDWKSRIETAIRGIEAVENQANDYNKNIAILETIRESVPNNSTFADVIDQTLFEYRYAVLSFGLESIPSMVNQSYINTSLATIDRNEENWPEKFLGTIDISKLVDKISKTKFSTAFNIIDITVGQKQSVNAIEDIVYGNMIVSGSHYALKDAEQKVKDVTKTGDKEKLVEAIRDYSEVFEVAKAAKISEYKKMLSYYEGQWVQSEYNWQQVNTLRAKINELKRMTIYN